MTGIVSPRTAKRLSLVICARSYTHITPLPTPISIDHDRQINTSKWPSNRYVRFVVSCWITRAKRRRKRATRHRVGPPSRLSAVGPRRVLRISTIRQRRTSGILDRTLSSRQATHTRFSLDALTREKKVEKIEVTSVTDRARSCLRQRGESLEKTNRFFDNTDKSCFRVCLRCRWTLRRDRFAGTTINRTPWRILDKIVPSLSCVGLANYPIFFVESRDPRQRGSNPLEIVAVINCVAI